MQYKLDPADLALVLALHRTGSLAAAGERLGVNASTVFRMLQRLERGLGQTLFERSRSGYRAGELARGLVEQAEAIEAALETARAAAQLAPEQAAGTVRITTTDTVLHGLVVPALAGLRAQHPLLRLELHTGNELASLSRRDADIALRATKKPPPHLIGRRLGVIQVAVYGARRGPVKSWPQTEAGAGAIDWVGPDDGLPDHPSVLWRRRHFPSLQPRWSVGSVHSVAELVAQGLGVGVLPLFLAEGRRELLRLTEPLPEAETELWLLTHPETRHLKRVHAVFAHLADVIRL